MKRNRLTDSAPKTQGLTRAEYVKQIAERHGLELAGKPVVKKKLTVADLTKGPQLDVKKIASIINAPPSLIAAQTSAKAFGRMGMLQAQFAASLQQSFTAVFVSGTSMAKALQQFKLASGRTHQLSMLGLNLLAADQLQQDAHRVNDVIFDPLGWVCDAVGFERSELADVRIKPSWNVGVWRVEVDLADTAWEPDYVVEMREVDDGLRNPYKPPEDWLPLVGDDPDSAADLLGISRAPAESDFEWQQRLHLDYFGVRAVDHRTVTDLPF